MSKKNSSKPSKFEFQGFINLSFDARQLKDMDAAIEKGLYEPGDCITVLVEQNYKVGFGFDEYHGVVQGTLTVKDPGSPYCGYCFTLKHSEPIRLIRAFRWFMDVYLIPELYDIPVKSSAVDW